jgi:ubiquinone biosynthesis protein
MMMNWDFLVGETALAAVLPAGYARFVRPIHGALITFLQGLPAGHQTAILAGQAALPPAATVGERLALLARSCPVLHKLGQILARDKRLLPELRRHLQELESHPSTIPLETIHTGLAKELGPLDRCRVTLLPPALAEASVAVVIPFRQDGDFGEPPHQGVFKLLKPGIVERLEEELELVDRVGWYLDQRCDEFQIPHIDYQETFEQVREKLRNEVRLDLEQQHLVQARAFFAGDRRIQVPALLSPCTPGVTAMERVTGGKVTEHGLDNVCGKRRLADLVVEALIARPFFSRARQALFHGDPHAGNLFLTADGRLAVLDWSLVGQLGEAERIAFVQILLGALTFDPARIVATLEGLAQRQGVDRAALAAVVRDGLQRLRPGQFPDLGWLMSLLDEATRISRLRVGANLLLFWKSLLTLEGVIADIGAGDRRIDEVLLREFFGHLAFEWPQRWLTPPGSRAFATRLSNTDLAHWMLSLPWTSTRCWLTAVSLV